MTETTIHYPSEWTPARGLGSASSVFHYTTTAGLVGIVESGTLWATEATGLNDTAEVIQGRRYISSWLESAPTSATTEWIADVWGNMADLQGWLTPSNRGEVFFLCASLDGDDANQWRNYAQGNGHAIELDPRKPLAVARTEVPKQSTGSVTPEGRISIRGLFDAATCSGWRRVAYGETECDEMMSDLHDWAEDLRLWQQTARRGNPDEGEPSPSEIADHLLLNALFAASALVKDEGFRGEREARVIVTLGIIDDHAHYRSSPFGLVRYVKVAEAANGVTRGFVAAPENAHRLPLKGVRLGPSPYGEQGVPTMEAFLRKYAYKNADVTYSSLPLRTN